MLNFRRRCDQIYTRETAIRRTLTLRCWTGGCTGTVLPRSSEPSGHEPMRLSAEICQPERELKTKTQKEGSWLLARIGKGATTEKNTGTGLGRQGMQSSVFPFSFWTPSIACVYMHMQHAFPLYRISSTATTALIHTVFIYSRGLARNTAWQPLPAQQCNTLEELPAKPLSSRSNPSHRHRHRLPRERLPTVFLVRRKQFQSLTRSPQLTDPKPWHLVLWYPCCCCCCLILVWIYPNKNKP
jgi:hypothetical protein